MSGLATAVIGSAVIGGVAANKASKRASDSADKAIEANAYQGEIAKDNYDEYKTTYRPLERALVAEAANYDTPENREKAAAEAQATVSSQIGLAKERLGRTPGLDPSSAAAQAAHANLELKGAALGAVSQNAARDAVADKAYARKFDAVGLGKGMVTNAMNGLASAAATAQGNANSQALSADRTASGVGAMVSGGINALSKIDWGGGANFGALRNQDLGGGGGTSFAKTTDPLAGFSPANTPLEVDTKLLSTPGW